MKLSFLIPVYNVEKYINRCLDSIIKQPHFDEYELIIRNDGSIDNTLNIINEYAKKYKNIKVLTGENVGCLKCRELLVKEASGEYIWFIDGDDEITDNAIESILKTCDDWKIDFDLMQLNFMFEGKQIYKHYNLQLQTSSLINFVKKNTRKYICNMWTKIVKKEIFLKLYDNSPVNINYAEDVVITFPLLIFIKNVLSCFDICYIYNNNNNNNNITNGNIDKINNYPNNLLELYKFCFRFEMYKFLIKTLLISVWDQYAKRYSKKIMKSVKKNIKKDIFFKGKKLYF